MFDKVGIIVPVYKEDFNQFEEKSLNQLFKTLGNKYIINFICPEQLNLQKHYDISKKHNINKICEKRFSSSFFESIQSYNRLMLERDFYKEFYFFDYILIHQLDCYIFKDNLEYWCLKNYDYIGAPWLNYELYNLSRYKKLIFFLKQYYNQIIGMDVESKSLFYRVGNGGLSLRKVNKFYDILKETPKNIINKYCSNDSSSLFNEDVFWSYEVNKGLKNKLKIPTYKIASAFSLELNPEIGIVMNHNQLPFGCHAWQKNLNFWREFIK